MWIDKVQYIALYQHYWKYGNGVYNHYSFLLWGVYYLTFKTSTQNLGIPMYSKPKWEGRVFLWKIAMKQLNSNGERKYWNKKTCSITYLRKKWENWTQINLVTLASICIKEEAFIIKCVSSSTDLYPSHFLMVFVIAHGQQRESGVFIHCMLVLCKFD